MPQPKRAYFDALDTQRAKLNREAEASEETGWWIQNAQAELKVALLLGWTPVIPSNIVWDSAALIESYAMDEDFLWLLGTGQIDVPLWQGKPVWETARDAFKDATSFDRFDAWPELSSNELEGARRLVHEAMVKRTYGPPLPEQLGARLDRLERLDAAITEFHRKRGGPPNLRDRNLQGKMKEALDVALTIAPHKPTSRLLRSCWETLRRQKLPGSKRSKLNSRTEIFKFLDPFQYEDPTSVAELREITNGCFNVATAGAVGAKIKTITGSQEGSTDVLNQMLPGSVRGNLFTTRLDRHDLRRLDKVDWTRLRKFLEAPRKKSDTDSEQQRTRRAEAAGLIMQCVFESGERFVIHTGLDIGVRVLLHLTTHDSGGSQVEAPAVGLIDANLQLRAPQVLSSVERLINSVEEKICGEWERKRCEALLDKRM